MLELIDIHLPDSTTIGEPEASLAVRACEVATGIADSSNLRRERAPRFEGHRVGDLGDKAQDGVRPCVILRAYDIACQQNAEPGHPTAFHRCQSRCEEVDIWRQWTRETFTDGSGGPHDHTRDNSKLSIDFMCF